MDSALRAQAEGRAQHSGASTEQRHPLRLPFSTGRKPVARIMLRPNATTRADPLADAIGRRQTNRKPYTGPLLTAAEAEQLRGQVSSDEVEVLTRIWFRFNERQRRTHRDGLSIPQTGTDGLKRRLVEWTLRNGNPKQWFSARFTGSVLKTYRQGIDSASGFVLLKTNTNHQSDWLKVGRAERAYVALRRDPQDFLIDSTPSSQSPNKQAARRGRALSCWFTKTHGRVLARHDRDRPRLPSTSPLPDTLRELPDRWPRAGPRCPQPPSADRSTGHGMQDDEARRCSTHPRGGRPREIHSQNRRWLGRARVNHPPDSTTGPVQAQHGADHSARWPRFAIACEGSPTDHRDRPSRRHTRETTRHAGCGGLGTDRLRRRN